MMASTKRCALILSALFAVCGCTHHANINGVFNGSATNHADQTIKAVFFTTGDDISVGKWESKTAFGDGEVTSDRPKFKDRSYELVIKDGACKGTFDMHLTIDTNHVSGHLDGGKDCPNSQIDFNLIKDI